MFDLYLIVDLLVVVALTGLGFTVLLQDRKTELNKIFAIFVTFIGVWIIANYISNDIHNPSRVALIANYFVFSFSFGGAYYLLRFATSLADDVIAKKYLRLFSPLLAVVDLMAFSPLVVESVHRQANVYAVQFGPLAQVYFLSLAILLITTMVVIFRNMRRAKGNKRGRLKVLFRSLCLTFPVLLLSEFILPTATGWFGLTNVGILSMLILVFGLYYSVVKHRLFDLRLLIVRSLGYIITLGTISVVYGVTSYYVSTLLNRLHNRAVGDLLNVALIILVAITYAPIKRRFDKLTNRLFYRDAYDPESLYNQLNQLLVSTLDLDKLLSEITNLLATELKAQYSLIGLKEVSGRPQRLISSDKRQFELHDSILLRKQIVHAHSSVIVAEDLFGEKQSGLRDNMNRNDIKLLVRLTSNLATSEEGLGYLALGPKKSGNPYTSQDFRVLDTIANELIIAIQNALHFEEIQNFNKTLQAKVVEATKELRRTNEKLKELDETKDDFISMASHQLRTPLTSVKGYLSMVLDGDAGKLTALERKMLTQSFISSQRMVYLISDLLNVSRLKTGKFVIEPSSVNLADIISDEIDQLRETAKGRNLTLEYKKPKNFSPTQLDETKTRQVVMNFIDNAIYYTPAGGHIRIELNETPNTVELRVIDDGIGVPKQEQHHLFTKFYRAGNARKARPDGTGLGLFMAKKVVIAQKGAIIFESKEGQGSTFGFSFPKVTTATVTPVS